MFKWYTRTLVPLRWQPKDRFNKIRESMNQTFSCAIIWRWKFKTQIKCILKSIIAGMCDYQNVGKVGPGWQYIG